MWEWQGGSLIKHESERTWRFNPAPGLTCPVVSLNSVNSSLLTVKDNDDFNPVSVPQFPYLWTGNHIRSSSTQKNVCDAQKYKLFKNKKWYNTNILESPDIVRLNHILLRGLCSSCINLCLKVGSDLDNKDLENTPVKQIWAFLSHQVKFDLNWYWAGEPIINFQKAMFSLENWLEKDLLSTR